MSIVFSGGGGYSSGYGGGYSSGYGGGHGGSTVKVIKVFYKCDAVVTVGAD